MGRSQKDSFVCFQGGKGLGELEFEGLKASACRPRGGWACRDWVSAASYGGCWYPVCLDEVSQAGAASLRESWRLRVLRSGSLHLLWGRRTTGPWPPRDSAAPRFLMMGCLPSLPVLSTAAPSFHGSWPAHVSRPAFWFIVCFKICLSGIQPGPGVLQRRKTVLEMEEPPVGVKWGEEHENVTLVCCQCWGRELVLCETSLWWSLKFC